MATYNTSNYEAQGGDVWVIGGELRLASTGTITAAGTQATAITDATAITGGESPTEAEHNALITKINAILAALRNVGLIDT